MDPWTPELVKTTARGVPGEDALGTNFQPTQYFWVP